MGLFALLLCQCDLETNKNGGIGVTVSSMHLHGCCCLESFRGRKIIGNIFYDVFRQQRGRAAFSLASNVRTPCCNI